MYSARPVPLEEWARERRKKRVAPPPEPLPALLLESALVARPLSRPCLFACDPSEGPGLFQPLRSPLRLLGLGAGLTALSFR